MLQSFIPLFWRSGMIEDLKEILDEIAAHSNHNGYWYSVQDILAILICGLLCGLQDVEGIHQWAKVERQTEFFKKVFGVKKIPCRAQLYNILATVNHNFFEKAFIRFMNSIVSGETQDKTIAIDGKSIRSTGKLSNDGSILHIASAILCDSQLVIGSCECGTKTGEVEAFRALIKMLDIKGSVVVADALHCKSQSAISVIEAGADYLFVVKDNNANLKESIDLLSYNKKTDTACTIEKNGGRIETRTAYLSDDIETLYEKDKWKNITCVGAIHREFEKNNQTSSQWHYYISSKKMTAEELLKHARMEWRVEAMHWLLDVHFDEDRTRIRSMEIQKNFNIMRKLVLNLIKEYQGALPKHQAMSRIQRSNLFDTDQLASFIAYFRERGN